MMPAYSVRLMDMKKTSYEKWLTREVNKNFMLRLKGRSNATFRRNSSYTNVSKMLLKEELNVTHQYSKFRYVPNGIAIVSPLPKPKGPTRAAQYLVKHSGRGVIRTIRRNYPPIKMVYSESARSRRITSTAIILQPHMVEMVVIPSRSIFKEATRNVTGNLAGNLFNQVSNAAVGVVNTRGVAKGVVEGVRAGVFGQNMPNQKRYYNGNDNYRYTYNMQQAPIRTDHDPVLVCPPPNVNGVVNMNGVDGQNGGDAYNMNNQEGYNVGVSTVCSPMCSVLCYRHRNFTRLQGIRNMSTMPEDACFVCYYAYGASAGREWSVNPAMQFKDDSISDADLALLNRIGDLLDDSAYRNFTWIGSGLQSTLRQSCPKESSIKVMVFV
ncbi:unnamed protein product [Cylicocyclus nassatus]|uniref:Trehalose-6-phosphate phosphatase C-terminal domain-containing protein n=1 Tax=Cylicocyclus nassatus TaxID=53992 RepID=A0AA36DQE9_CYLNA|nr:unnamed protein product [Cylicocyclus nassatus]